MAGKHKGGRGSAGRTYESGHSTMETTMQGGLGRKKARKKRVKR